MKKIFLVLIMCLTGLSLHAQSYKEYVQMAMNALQQDSLDVAEGLIRKALETDPAIKSNAILFQYLGEIQERQGKQKEALESYGQGINISPTTVALLLNRASLYMRMGNETHALSDYNSVLEQNEDHKEALFFRAYIYTQQHNYKSARADYEHLLRLDYSNENAQLGLILLNDKDARPREAMEQINALIQLYPTHGQLYVVRGGMEQQRRQYELALHDFNKALELEPKNPDFLIARGSYYMEVKKKKMAKADYQLAIQYGASQEEVAALMNAR